MKEFIALVLLAFLVVPMLAAVQRLRRLPKNDSEQTPPDEKDAA